ncbi:MAG: transcriptional repressor LexA [Elusimicrobia bacterium]|nr:MAG: transcriptional repressor LexA [Gammaproteobacteria bacterium]TXH24856.1 MAG: transcriptional repressor LexA [Elusimicrobiota bacterium]
MDEISLTRNQRRVLEHIREFTREHERTPTLREIAEAMGLARHSSAQDYVDALVRKGMLERSPHRGLRVKHLSRTPAASMTLPLVGRVAAGSPILAIENIEGEFGIDANLFRPRPDYFLRVVGSSMRDAGILHGDLAAVHRTDHADNGRIVVARIDDEVTLKTLELRNGKVRLLPSNPEFQPIDVDPTTTHFAIEGIYVGMIRRT